MFTRGDNIYFINQDMCKVYNLNDYVDCDKDLIKLLPINTTSYREERLILKIDWNKDPNYEEIVNKYLDMNPICTSDVGDFTPLAFGKVYTNPPIQRDLVDLLVTVKVISTLEYTTIIPSIEKTELILYEEQQDQLVSRHLCEISQDEFIMSQCGLIGVIHNYVIDYLVQINQFMNILDSISITFGGISSFPPLYKQYYFTKLGLNLSIKVKYSNKNEVFDLWKILAGGEICILLDNKYNQHSYESMINEIGLHIFYELILGTLLSNIPISLIDVETLNVPYILCAVDSADVSHFTPISNLPDIMHKGLLPSKSYGIFGNGIYFIDNHSIEGFKNVYDNCFAEEDAFRVENIIGLDYALSVDENINPDELYKVLFSHELEGYMVLYNHKSLYNPIRVLSLNKDFDLSTYPSLEVEELPKGVKLININEI